MDFNTIATDYGKYRKAHPEVLRVLLERFVISADVRVLEIGCGTGNYINAIQRERRCVAHGIDPADGMLAVARDRANEVKPKSGAVVARNRASGTELKSGTAEATGFAGGMFDLVYTVDVIHLMRDRAAYFREANRVLKSGGAIVTVTDSEEIIRGRLPMTKYFPETVAVDLARYPKVSDLMAMMREAGFERTGEETVGVDTEVTDIGVWKNRACSTLNLISDEAFERGKAAMERDLARGPIRWWSRYVIVSGIKRGSKRN